MIVVPILPYRLQNLKYDNISTRISGLLFSYSAGVILGMQLTTKCPADGDQSPSPWRSTSTAIRGDVDRW